MVLEWVRGRLVVEGADPALAGELNPVMYRVHYDPSTDRVSRSSELVPLLRPSTEVRGVEADPGAYRHLALLEPEHGRALVRILEESCRPQDYRPDFPWTLRPYQAEAAKAFERAGSLLVSAPTGSGKTIIGLYAAWRLRARTLVLVPTRELVDQWVRLASRITDACPYERGPCTFTVATYQSFRRARQLSRGYCLMIADEGHHLPAEKWLEYMRAWLWPARLVLSATPERPDGNHRLLLWFTLGRLWRIEYGELVEQGWLAPLEVHVVEVEPANLVELERLESRYKTGKALGMMAGKLRRMLERALAEDPAKEAAAVAVARKLAEAGLKVIVYADYVDQCERIASKLGAAVLHSRRSRWERQRALAEFRTGLKRILVATSAGDEGIDIPDADAVVMLSVPGHRQLVQRMGRILRPKPRAYAFLVLARRLEERAVEKLTRALELEGIPARVYRHQL